MFRESELVTLLGMITKKRELDAKIAKLNNCKEKIVLTWRERGPNGTETPNQVELDPMAIGYVRKSLADQITEINLKMEQIGIQVGF